MELRRGAGSGHPVPGTPSLPGEGGNLAQAAPKPPFGLVIKASGETLGDGHKSRFGTLGQSLSLSPAHLTGRL